MDDALWIPSGYAWKLTGTINELCKHHTRECALKLERFIPKQIWTKTDRQEVLNALSDVYLLGGDCASDLCIWLGPLILEIVSRIEQSALREGHSGQRLLKKLAVVMCKGFPVNEHLVAFAGDFVERYKPFAFEDGDESPTKEDKNQISDVDLCHAACCYLSLIPKIAKEQLSVPSLVRFLSSPDSLVRWYASIAWNRYHCMSRSEIKALHSQMFTRQEVARFVVREGRLMTVLGQRMGPSPGRMTLEPVDPSQAGTLQIITPDDLFFNVTNRLGNSLSRLDLSLNDRHNDYEHICMNIHILGSM